MSTKSLIAAGALGALLMMASLAASRVPCSDCAVIAYSEVDNFDDTEDFLID